MINISSSQRSVFVWCRCIYVVNYYMSNPIEIDNSHISIDYRWHLCCLKVCRWNGNFGKFSINADQLNVISTDTHEQIYNCSPVKSMMRINICQYSPNDSSIDNSHICSELKLMATIPFV